MSDYQLGEAWIIKWIPIIECGMRLNNGSALYCYRLSYADADINIMWSSSNIAGYEALWYATLGKGLKYM